MSEIGKAYIQIIPSSEGLKGKLTEMMGGEATTAGEKTGSTFAASMAKGIGTGAKIAAAAVATTTAAIAGATKAFVSGASDVAAYGDNIDKMSQKMGISAKGYQEWEAVMQHSGTSMETLKASMKTLANAVESGNGAFERLGITQEQIASMNNEELFNATITALQGVEDETERTYLAGQLLGRGATELGALLNTSAEDTQKMKDRVHELGGVMSDEAVKAAAHYQDSLQDMTTSFEGMKRGMMSEFLPSITTVMDGLTELFSGNSDKGIGMINKGISGFVDKMSEVLPKVIEVGAEIVTSLLSAIIDNLPKLIESGVKAIETLGKGIMDNLPQLIDSAVQMVTIIGQSIIENLPKIVEAGLQIILQLAKTLSEALPELIPTIVEVVIQIVQTIIDNVDLLVDAAVALITGLSEGLINALPILIDALPQLITALVQALIENSPQLMMVGPQLMFALIQGILTSVPELLTMGPTLVGELINSLTVEAPRLIDSGIEMVMMMIQGITDTISQWLACGVDLVTQMVDTLMREASKLIENGRQFVTKVKEGFMQKINEARSWGRDLLQNFIDGIMSKFDSLRSTLNSAADLVKSILGFSEPEVGPLSNFHTYAPDMMALFAKGIQDNTKLVTDQLKKSFDFSDAVMQYAVLEGGFAVADVGQDRAETTPAEATNGEPIILNAYFGQERIDTIIFEAIERGKYRMGGRV